MERFYPYLDIAFLVLIIVVLLIIFIRMLGKFTGLQKEDLNKPHVNHPDNIQSKANNNTGEIQENAQTGQELVKTNIYAEGSLSYKLDEIKTRDYNFNLKKFLHSSKKAFELVVTSFNKGDMATIEPFLTSEAFQAFSKFSAPEHKSVIIEDFLITDVVDIELKDNLATIKVKFLTRQKIDNNPKILSEIWSFKKNLTEPSTIWKLARVNYA